MGFSVLLSCCKPLLISITDASTIFSEFTAERKKIVEPSKGNYGAKLDFTANKLDFVFSTTKHIFSDMRRFSEPQPKISTLPTNQIENSIRRTKKKKKKTKNEKWKTIRPTIYLSEAEICVGEM